MTIYEIENLSFQELKSRRTELLEALKDAPNAELAERFLRARTDAKQRDIRAHAMGEEIAAMKNEILELKKAKP